MGLNLQDPTDTAYVHSVYAPITIRLVESFSKPGGWRAIEDVLKNLLPEPTVEEVSLLKAASSFVFNNGRLAFNPPQGFRQLDWPQGHSDI